MTHSLGKVKKKKFQNLKEASTLIYKHTICSLFRHLIVLLIYIFYHLIISCRLNVRFNVFILFLPDRPTHLHESRREGAGCNGKRNILLPGMHMA